MEVVQVPRGDSRYPAALEDCLGDEAPESIAALGNLDLLRRPKLALFCSVRCPGKLILQAYDMAQRLRDIGPMVVGGFHSPMEQEWLQVLLLGPQPVVLCPAREISGRRVPMEFRGPLAEGRLLLLSCLEGKRRRTTAESAMVRNRFVAALATGVLAVHAEPGGKVERLCLEIAARRQPLYTLGSDANENLVAMGAIPIRRAEDLKI